MMSDALGDPLVLESLVVGASSKMNSPISISHYQLSINHMVDPTYVFPFLLLAGVLQPVETLVEVINLVHHLPVCWFVGQVL
jgi:hypothetical protein